ncbi:MAG TPA: helicase-related protein [Syntrophales bacterium]|nr:helicase-related protein [Syntrophales bacterium]
MERFKCLLLPRPRERASISRFATSFFNYDIPWNPNRLEQRMGRIHRYGQRKDCLIFNFVATNTIEGRVL